jgi:hypothetical protein
LPTIGRNQLLAVYEFGGQGPHPKPSSCAAAGVEERLPNLGNKGHASWPSTTLFNCGAAAAF